MQMIILTRPPKIYPDKKICFLRTEKSFAQNINNPGAMFCSTESLREFYDACQKYVDSHTDYFYQMVGLIEDSQLSKSIYKARALGDPAPSVLQDWTFASWSTDRLEELMAARTKANETEFRDAYDAWYSLSSKVLAPIRIVWNMLTAMSLTANGVPLAVYERLSARHCLETMLYNSLRNYVSMARVPTYTEWATRMIDSTLFRLDPARVSNMLAHTVFDKFRYGLDKTVSLPMPNKSVPKMMGAPCGQAGAGISALFAIMRADVLSQTWNSYLRTNAIRGTLLMHPEVLFLRDHLRKWALRKNIAERSMTQPAFSALTAATGREGSKAFVASTNDEEQDALAIESMNRLRSIPLDESSFEPWRDMLSRYLADFLVPVEPVSNKRARPE